MPQRSFKEEPRRILITVLKDITVVAPSTAAETAPPSIDAVSLSSCRGRVTTSGSPSLTTKSLIGSLKYDWSNDSSIWSGSLGFLETTKGSVYRISNWIEVLSASVTFTSYIWVVSPEPSDLYSSLSIFARSSFSSGVYVESSSYLHYVSDFRFLFNFACVKSILIGRENSTLMSPVPDTSVALTMIGPAANFSY